MQKGPCCTNALRTELDHLSALGDRARPDNMDDVGDVLNHTATTTWMTELDHAKCIERQGLSCDMYDSGGELNHVVATTRKIMAKP